MAASTADDQATLDVAIAELNVFWTLAPPDRTWSDRALKISDSIEELARRTRDAGALADARSWRVEVALRMGDLTTAEKALILLESSPFGPTVVAQIMASIHRGAIAGLQADLSSMRAATARARQLAAAIDVTDAPVAMMDVAHRYVFGRDDPRDLEKALAAAVSLAATATPMRLTPVVRSMMAALAAEAGDLERAQKLLPHRGSSLLRWGGTLGGLAAVCFSEVAATCELPDLADATYRWLEPAAGHLMYNATIWTVFGSADHFLGRCASTLGRVDDAERHFAAALAIEQRLGAPHLQARTHLRLAELRTVRDDPIRRSHLDACLALCDEHHFTYLRSCAETLADIRPEQREAQAPVGRGPNRITREGDVWAISFDARTVRLRDTKGIRLLARLLTEPGHEIHALDLVGAPGLVGGDDGGPVLDASAKHAYRRRINDLAEDLEEARRHNDFERAARAESEIDAVTDQLAAAVGIGRRDRRAADQSERARVAATRNLRTVIQRAADVHPSLGRHLEITIRTGTYCSYQPDPRVPIDWTVD